MKLSTKYFINKIKNHSLKGLTRISNSILDKSTLSVLTRLYKEGAIQSLSVSCNQTDGSLFLATVNLRVVGGLSLLRNIKFFNSRNLNVSIKSLDRLTFKQVTVLVSTVSGINTSSKLKKTRSGGTLLLSF
jgi:ribosomal protein S8